jgi:hypothetical protein
MLLMFLTVYHIQAVSSKLASGFTKCGGEPRNLTLGTHDSYFQSFWRGKIGTGTGQIENGTRIRREVILKEQRVRFW